MNRYIYKATKDYEAVKGYSVIEREPYLVRKNDKNASSAFVTGRFRDSEGKVEIKERSLLTSECLECLKLEKKL